MGKGFLFKFYAGFRSNSKYPLVAMVAMYVFGFIFKPELLIFWKFGSFLLGLYLITRGVLDILSALILKRVYNFHFNHGVASEKLITGRRAMPFGVYQFFSFTILGLFLTLPIADNAVYSIAVSVLVVLYLILEISMDIISVLDKSKRDKFPFNKYRP